MASKWRQAAATTHLIIWMINLCSCRCPAPIQIIVQTHPEVIDFIRQNEENTLKFLESKLQKQILLKPRGSFHQEQFDVFALQVK